MEPLLCPEQIDQHFSWPSGRAIRLAKRGLLPHTIIPGGEIRFLWSDVEKTIKRVGPSSTLSNGGRDDGE